jgi:hypothetical protein
VTRNPADVAGRGGDGRHLWAAACWTSGENNAGMTRIIGMHIMHTLSRGTCSGRHVPAEKQEHLRYMRRSPIQ